MLRKFTTHTHTHTPACRPALTEKRRQPTTFWKVIARTSTRNPSSKAAQTSSHSSARRSSKSPTRRRQRRRRGAEEDGKAGVRRVLNPSPANEEEQWSTRCCNGHHSRILELGHRTPWASTYVDARPQTAPNLSPVPRIHVPQLSYPPRKARRSSVLPET